jgi:hypothetical protein
MMTSIHRIRLRGFWELQHSDSTDRSSRKVRLPMDFGHFVQASSGPVRLSRKFHCPTNLAPDDQVDIVVRSLPGTVHATLNGHDLKNVSQEPDAQRFVVTSFLRPTNRLVLEVHIGSSEHGCSGNAAGDVALEIQSGMTT